MIELINKAMLELQRAFAGRAIHPEGHASIDLSEQHALETLGPILQQQQEVTVFALDDRVIFDGQALPASGDLNQGLFQMLSRAGVDRVTFSRGVDQQQLRDLLDQLAALRNEPDQHLSPTTHVRFGFVDHRAVAGLEPASNQQTVKVIPPQQMQAGFEEALHHTGEDQDLKADVLSEIISNISTALSRSAGAVLPLANIKRFDEYTFIHTINVALMSTALGEIVGISDQAAHDLNMAALLHDVGKRNIPDELLNKKGAFTDQEFQVIRKHPEDGARILLNTRSVPQIAPIVAYEHHIRTDGGGYPKVPRGWKLNLASRIVQVADVFDALRSHRPYRPALPLSDIFEIMWKDRAAFDTDLLNVFFQLLAVRGVPEAETLSAPAA